MQVVIINPWYDLYGHYRTGFDAHMQDFRWFQKQRDETNREAFARLAKRK